VGVADDLPVIQESIKKGFLETQSKVNRWISDFKKRIDGDDEDEESGPSASYQRQDFGPSQSQQMYGIRRSAEMGRRSGDRERYDADPRVLGDDFSALELRDEDGKTVPYYSASLTVRVTSSVSVCVRDNVVAEHCTWHCPCSVREQALTLVLQAHPSAAQTGL